MHHLIAWENCTLACRFDQDARGRITCAYAPSWHSPISLSLPLDGPMDERAPRHFLEGLLPDDARTRERMRVTIGTGSTDVFDLLASVDVSGALTFTATEEPPAQQASCEAAAITPDDLSAHIEQIARSRDAWWPSDGRGRFSLAGTQPKFAVTILDDTWYWPCDSCPSTHIVKPETPLYPDLAQMEHATMELARHCGLSVAPSMVVRLGERRALLVKRFDRVVVGGTVRRLHSEDLAQAMGISPDDKYEPELADAIACLRRGGANEDVLLDLVRQMAFNAAVGNADAHAKNYSILRDGGEVRLSPLYDAISMAHWDELRYGTLSMPVNGVYDPWEVTLADWRAEATRCGLDPDNVEVIVRDVTMRLVEADYEVLPCSREVAREIEVYVHECTRDLLPDIR